MTDNEYILSWQRGDKDLFEAVTNYRIFVKEIIERYKAQKAEIKRLQEIVNPKCQECVSRTIECAKSEAYKEFAENWHKKLNEAKKAMLKNAIAESALDIASAITDNLVKELTEHKETVSMIDGHIEE